MELKLEVVVSSSIKRKKPWPRFCWLGQERESVFLLDDKRISEINMVSGRTKKKTPKLHPLLHNVVTMGSSSNGMWLCGLLISGELFMWNRDKDLLKTTTAVPEVFNFISGVQGNARRMSLQISEDGMRVLLVAVTGQVFLWQCMDARHLMGLRDCTVKGNWTQIQPTDDTTLPTSRDKETCVLTLFVKTEALGDTCLSTFVFTSGKKLIISCLKINWGEKQEKVGSFSYSIKWATKTFAMSGLKPPCQPVKSRGALVPAFSPDGQLLAIVLNQRQPWASQVLFVSTVSFVSMSRSLGGCGSKKMEIPSKYIRSYWVGCVSWSPGGLFLACVLKRGSLLMLARLGGLLTLSSSGCNIDFGPAHFLPLHPLVTYRPPATAGKGEASLSSSSLSVRDVMRQRYSVTWHPRLFYFIVSDGYMATVVRVHDRISPTLLMSTLLKDTTKELEKACQLVERLQVDLSKHVRVWFNSVSDLNLERSLQELSVTYKPNTTNVITSAKRSTLPYFLQDHGTMGNTKELLETVQTFEDDSDLEGIPVGSHVEDGGRLEFASMFDTLHALNTQYKQILDTDSDQESTVSEKTMTYELEKMQSNLLTAWAFGMSLGSFVEYRSLLLNHAVKCAVRFAALLQLMPNSMMHSENAAYFTLDFLRRLLVFIPLNKANSDGSQSIGLVVELCRRLVQLVLTPYTESYQIGYCQISSHNLSTALQILQMVSESLDHTYTLQQKAVWSSTEKKDPPQPWPLDLHSVHLLQDEKTSDTHFVDEKWQGLQQPSTRLYGVWRWIYTITQEYMEELQNFKGCENWEEEKQQLLVIRSKIQTVLQSTGERLEEGHHGLLNYTGEYLFLSGFYSKSAEIWRAQLWEESTKNDERRVFQEKRCCLALLYSLLSQYRLREAQELGDHMAHLILLTYQHQKDGSKDYINNTGESVKCSWLPMDLNNETAYAAVQTLGRFMASYFSNQTLYIRPPHNVDVLPSIHLPHASSVGRLVPLCQEEVAKAVRQQQLSEIWTVEYAQDLLFLGGLLPECVWLAYHLGDWKAAVSLSLAYTCHCFQHFDFTCFRKRELHLPKDLEPASILQAELKCLLSIDDDSTHDETANKSVTDPVEEEDLGLLQVSIQDILKASVMAGVDVVSSPLSSLLGKAKDLCSCLTAMVPIGLYLPSPPLYCPQPTPNTQDPAGTPVYLTEVASRHKVSEVLQKLLLLLRSAHCCYPAAQWYLSQLRRARHILFKMKKKYSYPYAPNEEKAFPEGLLKFINRSGYFRQGPKKARRMDSGTIQSIICFRELCGLCWMLHIRDQLSISCRKYQADRQARDDQIPADSEVRPTCVDALKWAQRILPFSRFLNSEEILQDTVLSLLSELPPVLLVSDTLVQAFPGEEESIRVPLREKYNSLMQSIRQCNVTGAGNETEEIMMVLIQDKLRLRKKHFGRLRRHLVPLELHLWEKEREEEDEANKHGMAMLRQLSLGTSLSTSTLTDCGLLPLCSDGDTTENISEGPVSPDLQNRSMTRAKKPKVPDRGDEIKTAWRIEDVIKEEGPSGDTKDSQPNKRQPSLPLVGSWEFELEDEEYLNFLELFLSYVLEKNYTDGSNTSYELPLLKDFSHKLREKELHSLTFDVLTTMQRRQRDGKSYEDPVFRAGCCFRPVTQDSTPKTSAVSQQISMDQNQMVKEFSQLTAGLFGHRKQKSELSQRSIKFSNFDSKTSPIRSAFPTQDSPERVRFCTVATVESLMELEQGLDTKLEAQFPELGRLLVWMMRWADRRLLLGQCGKKRNKADDAADDGVVIRVKASAPAVLTSLSMLEHRYTALLGTDHYVAHIQIPESQWTVTPVLECTTDGKIERESSIDTGYPASANTPITVLDASVGQEAHSVVSCGGEQEELSFHRVHLQNQNKAYPDNPIIAPSSESCEIVDDTCGKEDKHTDWDDSGDSFSISSEISCTPGTSLKLADLENSQNMSSSASLLLKPSPNPQPTLSTKKPKTVAHKKAGSKVPVSSSPADLTGSQPTTAGEPSVSCAPDQASAIQPPQMRQRLGEDLFRLVQNINYMSLMEVFGASYSSLQLVQQNSYFTQSNLNSNPNVPLVNVNNSNPPPPPVQTAVPQSQSHPNTEPELAQCTHAPVCMHVNQHSSGFQPHVNTNVQTTCSGASANHQVLSCIGISGLEMNPLSVQAESPATIREVRNLIPRSEGLLTTTDIKQTVNKAPVILPSNSSVENDPVSLISGLKLLQLHPPQVPHYVQRQGPQTPQSNPCHGSNPSRFKHNDQMGYARSQVYFNINAEPKPVPGSSYLHHQMSDTFRGQEVSVLHHSSVPQTLPVLTASNPQGLRLLQVQPVPSSNITFPKLPTKTFSRPSTAISIPLGDTPKIKLLQVELQPKMMKPLQVSLQKARLLPVEELRSTMGQMQNVDDTQVQLHRVERPAEDSIEPTEFSQNSVKRQRRRDKIGEAMKTQVTFRPNDSIIPHQLIDDRLIEAARSSQEGTHVQDSAMPRPLLRGEQLVEKAFATAAELHAFASTCKRHPECHDAFTNTDLDCPPVLVDKAVSAEASNTTSSPKTPGLRKEQMYRNATELTEEKDLNQDGRQFISVVDLEDQSLHHDLSPHNNNEPSISAEPTATQLHVMATNVLRSAVDSQSVHERTTDVLHSQTFQPVICEESVSLSHFMLENNQEDITADLSETEAEICAAIRTQSLMPQSGMPQQPTVWFSSRMSQLDTQLAALQRIADSLETDFSKSRMLLNTIEKVQASEVKSTTAVKKTIRLHVPQEGWTTQHVTSTEPDACDQQEERILDSHIFEAKSSIGSSKISFHNQAAGPCDIHAAPSRTCDLTELSDILEDENLEQTGLSDTVEILEQLVKEGFLSPTNLDVVTSTACRSRLDQEQKDRMSQQHVFLEDERKELRTWMRKKQRERLAVYQKHRQSLRERERKPFSSSVTVKSVHKNASLKSKEKHYRVLAHFNQRIQDACNLATDISDSPPVIQGFSDTEGVSGSHTARPSTALSSNSTYRIYSSSVRDKSPSGQTKLNLGPRTAVGNETPSRDYRKRLGLDRPVTSLPKDRLSQVTRRGMVTDTSSLKSNTGDHKMKLGGPSRAIIVERGLQSKKMENLSRASETYRVIEKQESCLDLAGLDNREQEGDIAGGTQWDWLDNLSDNGSSNLSKIDWAAIERMGAEET